MSLNDPKINGGVAKTLQALHDRAAQQPVSYIQLFRDAMTIAEDQFRRAMKAEAELYKERQRS